MLIALHVMDFSDDRKRRQGIDPPKAAQMTDRFDVGFLARKSLDLFVESTSPTLELLLRASRRSVLIRSPGFLGLKESRTDSWLPGSKITAWIVSI